MIPDKLLGKDFESLIEKRAVIYKRDMEASIGRYGVQVAFAKLKGKITLQPQASLPDFEGVLRDGSQFIFDAKVCSQSSFNLAPYRAVVIDGKRKRGSKLRQLEHMLGRSRFGVPCGFLIHWNERETKKKKFRANTYWFPVWDGDFWGSVCRGAVKSINRMDCSFYGVPVQWSIAGKQRTPTPDVLTAVCAYMNQRRVVNEDRANRDQLAGA